MKRLVLAVAAIFAGLTFFGWYAEGSGWLARREQHARETWGGGRGV